MGFKIFCIFNIIDNWVRNVLLGKDKHCHLTGKVVITGFVVTAKNVRMEEQRNLQPDALCSGSILSSSELKKKRKRKTKIPGRRIVNEEVFAFSSKHWASALVELVSLAVFSCLLQFTLLAWWQSSGAVSFPEGGKRLQFPCRWYILCHNCNVILYLGAWPWFDFSPFLV